MICKACKGAGTIIVPSRKFAIDPKLDPWDCKHCSKAGTAYRYHERVCRKCKGLGYLWQD